jgi:cystathionine beta-synthase
MPEGIHTYTEHVPPNTLDLEVIDRWVDVTDQEACQMSIRLAKEEAILVGGSSGAVVAGALKLPADYPDLKTIVCLLHDSGRSYLSKVFNHDWLCQNKLLESKIDSDLQIEITNILHDLEGIMVYKG